jgi:hypothetical protein
MPSESAPATRLGVRLCSGLRVRAGLRLRGEDKDDADTVLVSQDCGEPPLLAADDGEATLAADFTVSSGRPCFLSSRSSYAEGPGRGRPPLALRLVFLLLVGMLAFVLLLVAVLVVVLPGVQEMQRP